ncbi:hypothetical protein AJ79_06957 [Helicocarpus griseus UAMH5409]|uniref:Uncharacterized protein n=1 Tax=Helicocarpus griseus UAMH5409 TaxID=1447875 RepID=A0A2B7X810_9EURO|nr:hypothetical protein AJ79_06957 [Helicocarpus griseus UAMH5409]
MATHYLNYIKSKARISKPPKAHEPVLSTEDEAFLHRVASPEEVGRDPQIALMDGAQNIPLPLSPTEDLTAKPSLENEGVERSLSRSSSKGKKKGDKSESPKGKKKGPWNWIAHGLDKRKKGNTAEGLSHIAENLKTGQFSADEVEKEEEDLTAVLERLNIAAVNNRAFSISDETQELLKRFNVVLKDLINGVPTAYHDLESLLTNGDGQLQKAFNRLPDFLQKLVEQLPDKVTEKFGPEFLAMAAEKAAKTGAGIEEASQAADKAKKMGLKIPSLKELVGKPAAIVGMLRSIVSFLQARFPALMGMNVLMSLALFILLFVLWYCHKRGREARLEKEKLNMEGQDATISNDNNDNDNNASDAQTTRTTTALPDGGPTIAPEEATKVEAGVKEAQDARQPALPTTSANNVSHPASKTESQTRRSKIEPYPGT